MHVWLGFLAGILTTAANVPQLVTTFKRRSGEGLSFRMLLALAAGLGLWVCYGLTIRSWPVIVTNSASLFLVAALIALKFRYDRQPAKD